MAISTVIDVSLITDNVELNQNDEVVGTGIFDTLMETITRHIDVQYRNNKITGNEYATVYLGLVQTALSQAVDFAKNKDLLEAQTDKAIADVEIAKAQASEGQAKALAEITKVYGFGNATMDPITHEITIGADTKDGKLDYDRDLVKEKKESEELNNQDDGILANQILKLKEDVTISKIKTALDYAEAKANADKVLGYSVSDSVDDTYTLVIGSSTDDGKLDAEVNLTKEKLDTELINQQAIKAKVRDEYGREVDENGNDLATDVATLKHTHGIEKMVNDNSNHDIEQKLLKYNNATAHLAAIEKRVGIAKKLGVEVVYNEETGTYTESAVRYRMKTDGTGTDVTQGTVNIGVNDSGIGLDDYIPASEWEANMRKTLKEQSIAEATAKGYEADSYYKQYKSLQEMLFALANSGVITKESASEDSTNADNAKDIYANIVTAIEKNMNKQSGVWDTERPEGAQIPVFDTNGDEVWVNPEAAPDDRVQLTIETGFGINLNNDTAHEI